VFGSHVGHEPLQGIDGERLVEIAPVAGGLAGMVTNPPADRRERIFFLEKVPGLQISSLPDQNQGPFDVLAGWAAFIAGRDLVFEPGPEIAPAAGLVPFHGSEGDGLIGHLPFAQ
jgi:hypothetical protein